MGGGRDPLSTLAEAFHVLCSGNLLVGTACLLPDDPCCHPPGHGCRYSPAGSTLLPPQGYFEGKESSRGLEGRLGPFYRLRLQISAPGSATRKEGSAWGMAWPSLRSFHVSCLSRPAFQRLLAPIPKAEWPPVLTAPLPPP